MSKDKAKTYHELLEQYKGQSLFGITNNHERAALKKGLGLPVGKTLQWTFRCKKTVVDVLIEEIYKPSYSCRLCVTTQDGNQYRGLSDCFSDMQKK